MKSRLPAAKPLAAFLPGLVAKALSDRGISEAALVSDWAAIVGERVAAYARPIELQWPPRAVKRDPNATAAGATLVLRVDGAFALEAQHSAGQIVARVNAHIGWRCVARIAFRQGPLPKAPVKRVDRPPLPTSEAQAEARRMTAAIEESGLREALTRLGARAIDRCSARPLIGGE